MNLLHDSAVEIQVLKNEINEMMLREEMMWNQRSRALWIKCGDRNTKFFHATASNRQKKNRIEGLNDLEGRWREGEEEVWRALMQMHPTKSPGPDGMSPLFFQKYWDVVGPQVT